MNSVANFIVALTALATSASAFRMSSSRISSSSLDMKYKVAVVGGGPSGACAAEILAQVIDYFPRPCIELIELDVI